MTCRSHKFVQYRRRKTGCMYIYIYIYANIYIYIYTQYFQEKTWARRAPTLSRVSCHFDYRSLSLQCDFVRDNLFKKKGPELEGPQHHRGQPWGQVRLSFRQQKPFPLGPLAPQIDLVSVFMCVWVCCSELQCVAEVISTTQAFPFRATCTSDRSGFCVCAGLSVLQWVAVCCSSRFDYRSLSL